VIIRIDYLFPHLDGDIAIFYIRHLLDALGGITIRDRSKLNSCPTSIGCKILHEIPLFADTFF